MAKLPIYHQQVRPQGARASAADFGAEVGQAVSNLGDVLIKKQQKDDLVKAKQLASEMEIELYQKYMELQKSAPEDGSGFTEQVSTLIDESWGTASSDFSGPALEYLKTQQARSKTSWVTSAIQTEAKLKGEDRARTELDLHTKESNIVFTDPTQLLPMIQRQRERVESYRYDPETKTGISDRAVEDLLAQQEDDLYVNAARGMVNNVSTLTGARNVLRELETDEWQTALPSNNYREVIKAAQQKVKMMENAAKVELSAARSRVSGSYKDYLAYLSDGNPPARPADLTDENLSALLGEDAQPLIEQVKLYEALSTDLGVIVSGNPDEAAAAYRDVVTAGGEGPDNYIANVKRKEIAAKALETRRIGLTKDPADYALQHSDLIKQKTEQIAAVDDPAIRQKLQLDFTDTLVEEQRRLGVPEDRIQVLPSSSVSYYKDQFDAVMGKEGENLYSVIQDLKASTGPHFARAIRDLYEAKAAPKGLALVTEISDARAAFDMAEAITQFKSYTEVAEKAGIKKDEWDAYSDMTEYTESLFELGDSASVIRDVSEGLYAVNALALKKIVSGDSEGVAHAYEETIGATYDFTTVNGSTLRVPKAAEIESPDKKVILAMIRFKENFADQVDWDSVVSIENQAVPGSVSPEEIKNNLIIAAERGTLRVATAPSDDGIYIVTERGGVLPGKDGEPLLITWEELKEKGNPVMEPVGGA